MLEVGELSAEEDDYGMLRYSVTVASKEWALEWAMTIYQSADPDEGYENQAYLVWLERRSPCCQEWAAMPFTPLKDPGGELVQSCSCGAYWRGAEAERRGQDGIVWYGRGTFTNDPRPEPEPLFKAWVEDEVGVLEAVMAYPQLLEPLPQLFTAFEQAMLAHRATLAQTSHDPVA